MLGACGSEPEYGRWTTSEATCPGPEADTVAFGSDYIEFHVVAEDRTERIPAIVENEDGQLVIRFFNDVIAPMGTFVWTLQRLDERTLERVRVDMGSERQFEAMEGEPVIFHACP